MAHVILKNVNIRIPVYDSGALRLFKRGTILNRAGKVRSHNFVSSHVLHVQALSDLTLSLKDGDRLALIGHNGAGKTTLLRYIAGIYPEISGMRDVSGSVHFYGGTSTINPDATGYENVQLAMQIARLNMSDYERYKRDIEQFTELGEYLSMPTRIYSAGMTARLSFAIATMHTPEILLIDEGIGAGDAVFADKMEMRIKQFTSNAKIIVFASHSEALVRKMCNKGAIFEAGRMVSFGDIEDSFKQYKYMLASASAGTNRQAG